MSDNIVSLFNRDDGSQPVTVNAVVSDVTPNPTTVKVLEKLLAMAQTGRLQTFIGTGFSDDNQRVSFINAAHDNVYEMAGAIVWLQAEYLDLIKENR